MKALETLIDISRNRQISISIPKSIPSGEYKILIIFDDSTIRSYQSEKKKAVTQKEKSAEPKRFYGLWKNKKLNVSEFRKSLWTR